MDSATRDPKNRPEVRSESMYSGCSTIPGPPSFAASLFASGDEKTRSNDPEERSDLHEWVSPSFLLRIGY
jgi:hypothetical protein